MRMRQIKTSGQLTLGLAFGFTMVLVMFAFVFNTSMNVREKVKLQSTTDYATLVAANAQKEYLNEVRKANLYIEELWFDFLALQQFNHCASNFPVPNPPISDPSGTPYSVVAAQVGAYLTANSLDASEIPSAEDVENGVAGGDPCDRICDQYNNSINKKYRSQYAKARKALEVAIMKLIMNGNKAAFEYSLYHFLQPENLPWGLKEKLKSVIGNGYNVNDTMSAYENNTLNIEANDGEWGYDIISDNREDPLFVPKSEIRPFPIPNFVYTQGVDESIATYQTTCISSGARTYPPLEAKNSQVKVVKDGIFETHFFTGVNYMPPSNMFENNEALVKRKISPDELGQTEDRLDTPALFQRKIGMSTRAAAKPFGGSFPKSILTDLVSFATNIITSGGNADAPNEFKEGVGQKFEGAKLIGIADGEEIGGYEIFRANIEAEIKDEDGNIQEIWKILREDYLH